MRPLMGLEMLGRRPHLQRISPFSMEDGLRFLTRSWLDSAVVRSKSSAVAGSALWRIGVSPPLVLFPRSSDKALVSSEYRMPAFCKCNNNLFSDSVPRTVCFMDGRTHHFSL